MLKFYRSWMKYTLFYHRTFYFSGKRIEIVNRISNLTLRVKLTLFYASVFLKKFVSFLTLSNIPSKMHIVCHSDFPYAIFEQYIFEMRIQNGLTG